MNGLTRTVPGVALGVLLACGSASALPHAEFVNIGSFPDAPSQMNARAVTADKSTVIAEGVVHAGQGTIVVHFDMDTGAFTPLPGTGGDMRTASHDGSVIVGWTSANDPIDPTRRGAFGYYHRLGDPESTIVPNQIFNAISNAWSVSANGRYVVGYRNFTRQFNPCCATFMDGYIWDLQTMNEPLNLPDPAGTGRFATTGVSNDGQFMAGFAEFPDDSSVAVVWAADGSSAQVQVPDALSSRFLVMSANGRYAAGFALMHLGVGFDFREDGFIYDLQTQTITMMGQTPAGFKGAVPSWISDDGKTVVGTLNAELFYDFPFGAAFIWTEEHGLEKLADHILNRHQGVDPSEFRDLVTGYGASADGSVVVGVGRDQDWNRFPYAVRLGVDAPSCPADLTGDGVVDADDFFLFLQLFASGDSRADFNNDGVIDADDFFAYLTAFAAGC